MAIYAPRQQGYRATRGLGRVRRPYADLRPALLEGRAISNIGKAFTRWGQKLKDQRDAAVVGDLYNQWRDADRNLTSQLLNKRGRDAVNLAQQYDSAFNKTYGEVDKQAENGAQQTALRAYLLRKREQNLDVLARYEAAEAHRYRKESEAGVMNNAVADARGHGFDDAAFESTLFDAMAYLEQSNPGISPDALESLKRMNASKITYAYLREQVDSNPTLALENIEVRKNLLGESYYDLKQSAEREQKFQLVEQIRDELNTKHTKGMEPDFDAMEDDVQKDKSISKDIKDQVIVWIRSQESEYDKRQAEIKAELQDNDIDTIFGFINAGKYPDALQATLKSQGLNEKQQFQILELIKSQQVERYKTNNVAYVEAMKKAMRGEGTRDDYINLIGAVDGVSVDDGKSLLVEYKKAIDPQRKELNELIKKGADAIEDQLRKGSPLSGYTPESMDDAYKGFKEYMKQINNPPEGVSNEEQLDPESQHYIIDKIVSDFTPSFEEDLKRTLPKIKEKTGDELIFRKPDETIEEYLKRTNR